MIKKTNKDGEPLYIYNEEEHQQIERMKEYINYIKKELEQLWKKKDGETLKSKKTMMR